MLVVYKKVFLFYIYSVESNGLHTIIHSGNGLH